jgi:hypothetical protein
VNDGRQTSSEINKYGINDITGRSGGMILQIRHNDCHWRQEPSVIHIKKRPAFLVNVGYVKAIGKTPNTEP